MLGLAHIFSLLHNTWLTVTLSLDTDKEQVVLVMADTCSTEELGARVPEDSARYHLFRFKHTHQGDYKESNGEAGVSSCIDTHILMQSSSTPCRGTPCQSRRG